MSAHPSTARLVLAQVSERRHAVGPKRALVAVTAVAAIGTSQTRLAGPCSSRRTASKSLPGVRELHNFRDPEEAWEWAKTVP